MLLNTTIYHISLSKIPIIIHLSQFTKPSPKGFIAPLVLSAAFIHETVWVNCLQYHLIVPFYM